jgi:hypothetical protein
MVAEITAEIFRLFIYGSLSVVLGGLLFEGGQRYVKAGRSNEFAGKIGALPFFFATLILGFILQHMSPVVDSIAQAFPLLTRVGIIGVSTMALFNYSIPNFNYFDWKSLLIYLLFAGIGIYPLASTAI